MDRNQIIHDLAMEYTRFSMEEFRALADGRSARDNLEQLESFYLQAVRHYSKLSDDELPV